MLRHIVMFKLREYNSESEKTDVLLQLKARLEDLPRLIPQIKAFEVGLNVTQAPSTFDIVLNSVFDSQEDLQVYSLHPDHQAFVSFNKDKSIAKAVVDYHF